MPFFLYDREFIQRTVLFKGDDVGEILIASAPMEESFTVDYGRKLRVARGKNITLFSAKPIADDRCAVTQVQLLDAGGYIPAALMNKKVPLALMSVDEIREVFARDDEIDKQERDKMAALMGWNRGGEGQGQENEVG